MYLFYNLFLAIALILLWPIVLIAFVVQPKFRAGFWEKIGFYSINLPKRQTIWLHAVSVGEVNAVESLVKKLKEEFPTKNIILSTVTRTGQEVANNKLKEYTDKIIYFPYDFYLSIILALKAIRPNLVIIAETEIWPNFSNELKKKKIPLMIVNGRISPNSYEGYKNFSFFFKRILKNYTSILMQTNCDKKRILDIGANPEITETMGNLKFNATNLLNADDAKNLAYSFKLNQGKVIVAGSTHNGEDEIILGVYEQLKDEFADLKLIIAPRHPERYPQVLELIDQTGYSWGLRSKGDGFDQNDIIMLDTMGELSKMYSICHFAFIGGSFSGTGGHNPLEATIYNKPTLSGDIVFNFKDIYEILNDEKATILVKNEKELLENAQKLLKDTDFYNGMAMACQNVFEQNSGALDYAMAKIKKLSEK
ncbi:MAG: 3-deoxy-D-manno-octulosonic acid transferase [bacterium]